MSNRVKGIQLNARREWSVRTAGKKGVNKVDEGGVNVASRIGRHAAWPARGSVCTMLKSSSNKVVKSSGTSVWKCKANPEMLSFHKPTTCHKALP